MFDTIVRSAGHLCGAESAVVYRFEDDTAHFVAGDNVSPETLRDTDHLWRITDGSVLNIEDIENDAGMSPTVAEIYRARGVRSAVWVPMRCGAMTIGTINVAHRDVGAFSDARVDLLRTFADQAVIAIENVRLFTELEACNRDLSEALEQQTATADILRVISSSPTNLQPFWTPWRKARRGCAPPTTRISTGSTAGLCLLDLLMPEMDGFEFVLEFRRHAEWRHIPVVVLTSKDLSAEDRQRLSGQVERILYKGGSSCDSLLAEVRDIVAVLVSRRRGHPGRAAPKGA